MTGKLDDALGFPKIGMHTLKAILLGPESSPHADVLRAKLKTPWELRRIPSIEPGSHAAEFVSADALISVRFDEHFPSMPALKLLQAASAGVNSIRIETVPARAAICNAYGHQIAVAEYVLLSMLACAHNVVKIHQGFIGGKWYWSELAIHPTHAEVYGKTVCIIGLGRIGRETARRARALGMHVIGCNRTTRLEIPEVDEIVPLSHVADCVPRADFVVAACALAEETRSIVDGRVFNAMKKSAFIINVGRGPLIHEAELYNALFTRRIAGAVLDAWYRYPSGETPHPAPSDFPFHQLDNVIMTPHTSGWTDGMIDRRWSEIARNLDSLALGKAFINIVRPGRFA